LQGAELFGCWHTLDTPLHVSSVQPLPSSAQAVPFDLNVQLVVQHDASVPFAPPSSHTSGESIVPSPQSEK